LIQLELIPLRPAPDQRHGQETGWLTGTRTTLSLAKRLGFLADRRLPVVDSHLVASQQSVSAIFIGRNGGICTSATMS